MTRVYLGIGSNIDPEANLRLAVAQLRRRYGDVELSTVYRNASVGFDGAEFLNMVVAFDTDATPRDVHLAIKDIHKLAGRGEGSDRLASRPLDIDLLLYGQQIINEPPLRVPRADVLNYSFVLRPLAEIAPDLSHPQTGRSLSAHWRDYDAGSHPLTVEAVVF